ncbi:MAG: DUF2019 domain-containing protein [Rhizobiaceae bacterium]|nr:DUF2019 domain-containing protein [Rhizobiaceae bacterium]
MTKSLAKITTEELVDRFVDLSIREGIASFEFDTRTFNRLFARHSAIARELRSRPGDQRFALFPLYKHPDMQVRLNAIGSTFALNREAAERELRFIARNAPDPQGFDARMSLSMLELGLSMLPDDPW